MSALSAGLVLAPLLLAALLAVPPWRRAALALAPAAALPALYAALSAPAAPLEAPLLLLGMQLGLDATGQAFLLFTAPLWLVAGASAQAYMAGDAARTRFWFFFLLTQAGSLLLVVALDAASFYLGFALMTFAAYGLVVHAGSAAARRAGRVYLVMAVLGEAALLAGLFFALAGAQGIALPLRGPPLGTPALVLLFAGFAVKAGVPLLHMWLPLAHPVAPTPASAVLSGAMIKAGVLGWMRFLPLGEQAAPGMGTVVMGLGLTAMFGGALIGLLQRDAKTVLAYSSVSQMGFLTLGVGAGLVAPFAWPALASAVTLYALHHGLAKGALFLGVGALPAAGRARAWALAALALPALALAGAPFTSGLAAKTGLKAPLAMLPSPWPMLLEILLPLAAIGTTLLMARFLVVIAVQRAAAKPGLAPAWLAAVALSAASGWVLAAGRESASWLAASWPIALGVLLALAVLRRRPARATPPRPALPPGDLLVWAWPVALLVWRMLLAAGRWPDRQSVPRLPMPIVEGMRRSVRNAEARLARFTMSGAALLVLAVVLAALLWRA